MSEDLAQYLGNIFLDFLKMNFIGILEKVITLGIKKIKIAKLKNQISKNLSGVFTSNFMRTSEDFRIFLMNLINIESFEGTTKRDLKEKVVKKLNLIIEDNILENLIEATKKILKNDPSTVIIPYIQEKFNLDFCYSLFKLEKGNPSNEKVIRIIHRSIFDSFDQFLSEKDKVNDIHYAVTQILEDFDQLIHFGSIIIPTNNKHKFLYVFCY